MSSHEHAIELHQKSGEIEVSLHPRGDVASNYLHQDFKTLISDIAFVDALFVEKGHLWAGGEGGVAHWTISSTGISYTLYHSEHGLAGQDISCLYKSESGLYCGHTSGYVSHFDTASQSWRVINSTPVSAIKGLAIWKNQLWAATHNGIEAIDGQAICPLEEPALCVTHAHGTLFAGTMDAVFRYDLNANLWEQLGEFPFVTQLKSIKGSLWIGSQAGLHIMTPAGDVKFTNFSKPIDRLCEVQERGVYILADNRVHFFDPKTQKIVPTIGADSTLLAADEQGLVILLEDELRLQFHDKISNVPLWSPNTPHHILSVTPILDSLWIQTMDYALWQNKGSNWQRLSQLVEVDKITGAIQHDEHILLGLYNQQGIARWNNTRMEMENSNLAYVRSLFCADNSLYAIASEQGSVLHRASLWHFNDSWKKLAQIPADGGTIFSELIADSIYLLMGRGLWSFEHQSWIHRFNQDMTMACVSNEEILASDGEELYFITLEQVEKLDFPQRYITAVFLSGDDLYVGTPYGLYHKHTNSDWIHWQSHTSGLAHNSIIDICMADDRLFVQTGYGLQNVNKP